METDGAGWEQQQDNEERQFFEEAQEALKADAEAYNRWLEELDRELSQTERDDARFSR